MFNNKKIKQLEADLKTTQNELVQLKQEKLIPIETPMRRKSLEEKAHDTLISTYNMLENTWKPVVETRGQESIIDTLYGIPNLRSLTNYVQLIQIPFMVRESMPYKTVLIRTIVQLDFVRFIGRLLFEECPTFGTALEAMRAKIFGPTGLSIAAYSFKEGANKKKVDELNKLIKEADNYNNFSQWQKECFLTWHIEGESFIQVKTTRSTDEEIEIRLIPCDFIRPSILQGQSHEDPAIAGGTGQDWSFGILDKKYQWYKPEKYNIVYPPEWNLEEVVDAADMFHAKNVEHRNMKRGIPSCFKLVDDLVRITILREALTTGAISRSRIAGVIKYTTNIDEGYVKTDLSKLAAPKDNHTFDLNPTQYWHDEDEQAHFLGLLAGRDWSDYPHFDAASAEIIMKMGLSTIAAYYHLPLSTFGLAEEHSYAASEVEESVPDTCREEEQGYWCDYWKRIIKRILDVKTDVDWSQIDIEVKGPSMVQRDIQQETDVHIARINAKLEARSTAQSQLGLDPEDEDDKIANDEIQLEKEKNETDIINKEENDGKEDNSKSPVDRP